MIKIQYILTLLVTISLVLHLPYLTLKFTNGQMETESNLILYNDDKNNSKNAILNNYSNNTILKPKIDVSIEGTLKSDKLMGGEGDDKIKGGTGNDILYGKDGNDMIKGDDGDDRISAGSDYDELEGGTGNDKIFGGDHDDLLDGGEGNDILDGGRGIDIMIGGLGNDTFICDPSDILIDFNSSEEDKIIGSCSVQSGDEKEGRLIPNNDIYSEEFQSPPLPLNPNDSFHPEEFQSGPHSFNLQNNVPPNFESQPPFHPNDIPPSEFESLPPPPPRLPPQQPPFYSNDAPSLFEPRLPYEFQLPPFPFNDRDIR